MLFFVPLVRHGILGKIVIAIKQVYDKIDGDGPHACVEEDGKGGVLPATKVLVEDGANLGVQNLRGNQTITR